MAYSSQTLSFWSSNAELTPKLRLESLRSFQSPERSPIIISLGHSILPRMVEEESTVSLECITVCRRGIAIHAAQDEGFVGGGLEINVESEATPALRKYTNVYTCASGRSCFRRSWPSENHIARMRYDESELSNCVA